jgi:Secretion system C-terminal sorting domain
MKKLLTMTVAAWLCLAVTKPVYGQFDDAGVADRGDRHQGNAIAGDIFGGSAIAGSYETEIRFNPLTVFSGNPFPQGYVVSLDNNGNPLWMTNFESSLGTVECLNIIGHTAPTSNYTVCGYFQGELTIIGPNQTWAIAPNFDGFFVVRLDASGDPVSGVYGGASGTAARANSVDFMYNFLPNDYVLVTGFYEGSMDVFDLQSTAQLNGTTIPGMGMRDVFIMKIDLGVGVVTPLALSSIGGNGDDEGNGISSDNQGNVMVCGVHSNNARIFEDITGSFDGGVYGGKIMPTSGGDDAFLVKFNSTFNYQWNQLFRSPDEPIATDIDVSKQDALGVDGITVISGIFYDDLDFLKEVYSPGQTITPQFTLTDPIMNTAFGKSWVAAIDQNGNLLWANKMSSFSFDCEARAISYEGGNSDVVAVVGLADHGMDIFAGNTWVATGQLAPPAPVISDPDLVTGDDMEGYITVFTGVQVPGGGALHAGRLMGFEDTGIGPGFLDDITMGVSTRLGGSFVTTGFTTSSNARFRPFVFPNPSCTTSCSARAFYASIPFMGVPRLANPNIEASPLQKLTINPNPTSGIFQLSLTTEIPGAHGFIFDSFGRKVSEVVFTEGNLNQSVDLTDLAAGIYAVKIYGAGGIELTSKIVKQ